MSLRLGVLGLLTLLAACSSAPPEPVDESGRPDWVLNPPARSDTVYGVGGSPLNGDLTRNLDRARQAATANLVTNLRVQLVAETRSRVSSDNDTVSHQFQQDISSLIPDIQLDDTRLVDTWEDPSGYIYALVSLNTREAARQVRTRFQSRLDALSPPDGDASEDLWQVFTQWQRTLALSAEMDALDDLHSIFTGEPAESGWADTRSRLHSAYLDFAATITLSIQGSDSLSRNHVDTARDVFRQTRMGMTESDDADWTLTFSLSDEAQTQDNTHFHFVTGSLSLRDETGRVRWQGNHTARGVAGSPERAQRQGVRRAMEALYEDFQTHVGDITS